MKNEDKITPDFLSHFAYDLEKTVDFFTLSREDFLLEHDDTIEIQYNNTCLFWLNRINRTQYIQTPIYKIEGRDIAKIYHKMNFEPLDLFILCS